MDAVDSDPRTDHDSFEYNQTNPVFRFPIRWVLKTPLERLHATFIFHRKQNISGFCALNPEMTRKTKNTTDCHCLFGELLIYGFWHIWRFRVFKKFILTYEGIYLKTNSCGDKLSKISIYSYIETLEARNHLFYVRNRKYWTWRCLYIPSFPSNSQ